MKTMNYSAPQRVASSCQRIRRNCIFCGTEFYTHLYRIRQGFGLYCGLECRSQHRHIKAAEVRVCVECGNLFLTKKISTARFCSRGCSMVTFYSRRHKARHYKRNPIHDMTPEQRKKRKAFFASRYRQSEKGKAVHRQDSTLRKAYGTAAVPMVCRKVIALRRAINKGIKPELLNSISEGRTHEAYL